LDALAGAALPVDAQARRLGARIDAQIRKLLEGSGTVSERLMRDTLYSVAIARATAGDHLECVRAAYRLSGLVPARVGATDADAQRPLLRAVRERLQAAMDEWSRFCAGTAAALPAFHDHVGRLDGQAAQLGQPDFARLAGAVTAYANQLRRDPLRHDESAALEIATALLLQESALDNFASLDAEFAHQADVVVVRIGAMMRGEAPASAELPQLDEMGRRAQERLLMSQVAKEILVNLGSIEQTLDSFFRDPTRTAELAGLANPVNQVAGALAVLGQERAAAVLREAEERIATFGQPDYAPDQADFEEVAGKLSALGFFVERLPSGSADIDAILNPPAPPAAAEEPAVPSVEAELEAARRMTQTLAGALRDAPEDALLRTEIRQNLAALREDARLVADDALERQADNAIAAIDAGQTTAHIEEAVAGMAPAVPEAPTPSPEALRLAAAGSAAIDAELLAIFLEEAHEVLATIAEAYPHARAAPEDHAALVVLRRAFHTLKGSGRMVGLADLGEAAWAVEQVMNGWLQQEKEATPALLDMIGLAHELFRAWVAQLESGGGAGRDATELAARCERLRSGEDASVPLAVPPVEVPPAAVVEAAAEPPPTEDAVPPVPDESAMPPESARAPVLQLVHSAAPEPEPVRVGDLVLSATLYDLYRDEARGHIATLQRELGRDGTPRQELIRAAHTLASISATTGVASVHGLAHALEVALVRFAGAAAAPQEAQRMLLARVAGALEGMLGAVAERRLPAAEADLTAELEALVPAVAAAPAAVAGAAPQPLHLADELDPQLLPLFLDESQDLLPEAGAILREWRAEPEAAEPPDRLKRLLHTYKGSARMAGAMAVGEHVHAMESRIGQAAVHGAPPAFLDEMDAALDRIAQLVEGLRGGAAQAAAEPEADAALRPHLRVRADVVDRLVNEAGEMAIARSRIEGEMRTLKASLFDLTENVVRLRGQLREIEIQAEGQMQSRQADTASARQFDPLEFDRFTRFQELTRMMAESVNDVATVQHNLLKNLDHANSALTAQARLNRELSQALMGVRMVPFDTIADRLHRVVRQAAQEADRRASLDIRGGHTGIDRSVLDRITASLEHLLRNAVVHG
ncbi:MAG: Hpt domain-containing protein, partial [Rhodocyclaceae bacterium]|nr:Hpt domain-containing protein [Rhodocyclaceae bacterium]